MHTVSISFGLPIRESQTALFKQAILNIEGIDHSFYNNKSENPDGTTSNIHRYPMIQFRVQDGYAGFWAVNEGAVRLEADLKAGMFNKIFWLGREHHFPLVRHFSNKSDTWTHLANKETRRYLIRDYLPFSNHTDSVKTISSHEAYLTAGSIYDKISLLEQVITSHLVLASYGTGAGLNSSEKLNVKLVDFLNITSGVYKKGRHEREKHFVKMDVVADINAFLPEGMSIGNQVSLGYGVMCVE